MSRSGHRGFGRAWPLVPALLLATLSLVRVGGVAPSSVLGAGDPVIAAAGDIACDPTNAHFFAGDGDSNTCRMKATSDLLVNHGYAAVLPLGDNQYYCGGYSAFVQSYDLSWGRVKAETHPVVGNHEFLTSGGTGCDPSNTAAAGYFQYFGAAAGDPGHGYYSYDVGAWHLVALNSNCGDAGGCSSGSPQYTWLSADLAADQNACTLAYWHIPLFSSGGRAAANMRSLWTLLYDKNAELVLSGHDHIYERFAPQTSAGVLDTARGLRSFIVGTGGANHTSIATVAANSEVRDVSTYGILQLTLHATSYDWSFKPEAGKTFTDSGTDQCHGGGTTSSDTTAPSIPQGLTATATTGPAVSLGWNASTDAVGVTGYGVYRNGALVTVTTATSYVDSGVAAGGTYQYAVDARDAAGNISTKSASASVTVPGSGILTFGPTADAYTRQDKSSMNFGTGAISLDAKPAERGLLRFAVSGVGTGGVASAKLRLYCTNPSASGGSIRSLTGSWSESTVTWNASPVFGSTTISSRGSVANGRWYEFDVTPLVTGNGTVDIGMVSTSADGVTYVSREGTVAQRPQLVVTPNP
jgi:Calcineurin-like phosphoesterase